MGNSNARLGYADKMLWKVGLKYSITRFATMCFNGNIPDIATQKIQKNEHGEHKAHSSL